MKQGHEAVHHAFVIAPQALEVGEFIMEAIAILADAHGFFIGGQGQIELIQLDKGIGQAFGGPASCGELRKGTVKRFIGLYFSADSQVQRPQVHLGHGFVFALFQPGFDQFFGRLVILQFQQRVQEHVVGGGVFFVQVV